MINELIAAIKELKVEVQANVRNRSYIPVVFVCTNVLTNLMLNDLQRQETRHLRDALENCEACKPG